MKSKLIGEDECELLDKGVDHELDDDIFSHIIDSLCSKLDKILVSSSGDVLDQHG